MKTAIRAMWVFSVPALALVLVLSNFGIAQDKPKDEPKKPTVMQRTLALSHATLDALAKKDF